MGGCVKELYEGDPEPLVLTMARQPYNVMSRHLALSERARDAAIAAIPLRLVGSEMCIRDRL